MRKIAICLFTLLLASAFSLFAEKRLPYVLQKDALICDTIYTLPDAKAQFPGGTSAMYNFFKKNLDHSEELTNLSFSRRLLINLLIDEQGKIVSHEITVSLTPEYDTDALQVVAKLPDFIPAKANGRNVCSYLMIPLNYK